MAPVTGFTRSCHLDRGRLHGERQLTGAARLPGRPPLLLRLWRQSARRRLRRQSAGGFSVMAIVPVKISSLTMKAIAVM
jgi:hypothetical protein